MRRWTAFLLAAILTFSLTACGQSSRQEETAAVGTQVSEAAAGGTQASETAAVGTGASAAADSTRESETAALSQAGETSGGSEADARPAETGEVLDETGQTPVAEEETGSHMLIIYFTYAENAELAADVDASSSASIQVTERGLTGNTGLLADLIEEATQAERFSIQTTAVYPDTYEETLDQGQQERNDGARPELAALPENLDSYETIFLGYPTWWGDLPMAVYSFLESVELSGKTIVPFNTSGGSGLAGTVGTIEDLQPDATVLDGLSVRDSSAAGAREQVNEWLTGLGYIQE